MRKPFYYFASLVILVNILAAIYIPILNWNLILTGPILIIGLIDIFQKKHSIRSNFPVLGHFRYILEAIRPEINQYFVESNTDGRPFSREERSIVYQRAKKVTDTLPFGTQKNVYQAGYEFVTHSIVPKHVDWQKLRVEVGGPDCKQKYSASIFNVSAMSYGSLSQNAIMALNKGAKLGNFAHNTGEGGLSPYHKQNGGDLIWQIGTGYFGCRDEKGNFDEKNFSERANLPQVKMIEIKLSQGAKPGHGGILPKEKLTKEISEIRGVPMGQDVVSPPGHSAFSTPKELVYFIKKLRDLSNGKPVGFKLCIGNRHEFVAICKAMVETGIKPDFITVDGGEGGTGAAPLEFSNYVGTPGIDGLMFVNNILKGFDLRKHIKIISTGKVTTGFGLIKLMCLGADLVYSARAMLLAIGCIQALRCNTNHCPAGVATQNPDLVKGLDVGDKSVRVKNFHQETVKSAAHLMEAMGIERTQQLKPVHIKRRINEHEIKDYNDFSPQVEVGSFLKGKVPSFYENCFDNAQADTFKRKDDREEAA